MHLNPSLSFHTNNMTLPMDADASYLCKPNAKSRAAAYMYLTKKNSPDFHNGTVLVLSSITKYVMSSTAKSELAIEEPVPSEQRERQKETSVVNSVLELSERSSSLLLLRGVSTPYCTPSVHSAGVAAC